MRRITWWLGIFSSSTSDCTTPFLKCPQLVLDVLGIHTTAIQFYIISTSRYATGCCSLNDQYFSITNDPVNWFGNIESRNYGNASL